MIPWADYIRNNFWLKIFSLGLAMLIWYAVRSPTPKDIGFSTWTPWQEATTVKSLTNMPVVLLVLPDQGQRFTVSPATADMAVQGPVEAINNLSRSDIKVYAHILDVNSPIGSFPLKTIVPDGITVLSVNPSSVAVESTSEPFRLFPSPPIN